jgi:hypothetical protein
MDYLSDKSRRRWNIFTATLTLSLLLFYLCLLITYYNTGNNFGTLFWSPTTLDPLMQDSSDPEFHGKKESSFVSTYQVDINVIFQSKTRLKEGQFSSGDVFKKVNSLNSEYLLYKRSRDPPHSA